MKRLASFGSLGLSAVLTGVLFAGPSLVASAQYSGDVLLGDVNGDFTIDVNDSVMVLQASVGSITLTPAQAQRADVNEDGFVNVTDANQINRVAVGLEPTTYWNVDISGKGVASDSATIMQKIHDLDATHRVLHPDFGQFNNGIPFLAVNASGTLVPKSIATFTYKSESDYGFDGDSSIARYVIPANAPIEGGSGSGGDRHVIVVDKKYNKTYELWNSTLTSSSPVRWAAGSGAIWSMWSYKRVQNRAAGATSADAAGLPIYPGLLKYDEVKNAADTAGEINHAVRFTLAHTRTAYVSPANHQAGDSSSLDRPEMGRRFRLKASYNISGYSAMNQVILKALKKYGMILADNGGNWYLSGVPDDRWNDSDLHNLQNVPDTAFELVAP